MATKSADDTTKDFTVAKGRTIRLDGKDYGPETSVKLTEAEGERLQGLGFLQLDDGSVTVPVEGPATENGVEIKEQP